MNSWMPLGHAAGEERDDPRDQNRDVRGDPPDHEPDRQRNREQQAEEDGDPGALQVVVDDQADRVCLELLLDHRVPLSNW